ncbi:MAG TPA: NAD(P)/FAD-dependent oxidoreductase [Thermomicrobiales bacterium]|nr:NAD(P)/FAD-dependent oxidoreductase [Thermomicrobiales bacterium]
MATNTYDVLIVGGGHNGLIAACYLAKAGHSVCVLERYHEVGGAAYTQEIHPGYLLSEGSYVLSLMPQKIIQDLGVTNDIELVKRNPRFFMPFPDGRSLTAWEDDDRFLAEIAKFSTRDAANYHHYDDFVERASQVMDKFILRNPPSFAEFASEFRTVDEARIFLKMILGSAADVAEYFFESEQIQANAVAFGLIGTFRGPRDAGTAYVKLYHSMGNVTGRRGQWAYVRGAMGAVTQAYKRVALGLGVTIRTSCEVEQICTSGSNVSGAITTSGEEFHAPVALSNADPVRTYTKLVRREHLPADFLRDIEAIQITSPVMKINLALDELPRYIAAGEDQSRAHTGGVFIGPSIDYMQTAYEQARVGEPSDYPFFSVHTQSALDPSVAPKGKATLSIFTQYFPYHLAEGTWAERREAIADHALARYAEYAPNVPGAVVARQVLAPPDIEDRFGLTGGHIFQGELVPEQAFDMRPVPGSSSYEGPIHGLYLCGSGAWPGGCVMGAPGHNAAHEAITKIAAGHYRQVR